jgi:hypothetical protein
MSSTDEDTCHPSVSSLLTREVRNAVNLEQRQPVSDCHSTYTC